MGFRLQFYNHSFALNRSCVIFAKLEPPNRKSCFTDFKQKPQSTGGKFNTKSASLSLDLGYGFGESFGCADGGARDSVISFLASASAAAATITELLADNYDWSSPNQSA